MSAIELQELRKVFPGKNGGLVAVDGLSLTVERGEVFGLLGPNGAGKTTTVEICEGLQAPTSGVVRILGETWGGGASHTIRQRIGVALQETHFFERQTVREILTLFASFFDAAIDVDGAIAALSLQEKVDTRTAQLSGGQRQRLAVACALVGQPDLLFLDEPTTGLDPQSRRSLWEVIRAFRARGGTVLLTTHYLEEAEELCDRVGVVDHGRLIAHGAPRELITSLGGEHVLEIAIGAADATTLTWTDLAGVSQTRVEAERLTFTGSAPHQMLPAVLRRLAEAGIEPLELGMRHASLEDVFVALTGRHLRDGEAG